MAVVYGCHNTACIYWILRWVMHINININTTYLTASRLYDYMFKSASLVLCARNEATERDDRLVVRGSIKGVHTNLGVRTQAICFVCVTRCVVCLGRMLDRGESLLNSLKHLARTTPSMGVIRCATILINGANICIKFIICVHIKHLYIYTYKRGQTKMW